MASLDIILTALQNGVAAINSVAKSVSNAFPQVTGTSSTATVGALTFNSSQPAGFITVVSTAGTTIKVPYYNA